MSKLRVGVVFGGKSAEHEVSLQSAKNIVEAIDKNRFDVVLFGVDKQGQWHVHDINHYLLMPTIPATLPSILQKQKWRKWWASSKTNG